MVDETKPAIGRNSALAPVDQPVRFLRAMAQIVAIWTLSDLGYYLLIPKLGLSSSYNAGPIGISLYYVFWNGIAIITFWPLYVTWTLHGNWTVFESRLSSYLVWCLSFGVSAYFAAYVLPALPTVTWTESWEPPELRVATSWYFLPKSVEIVFQQLLILALVLALAAKGLALRRISIVCALVFGAAHILLAFANVPALYVVRFMVSAALFGLVFPYLLLRIRNGFAYSYVIHWTYYAASVVLPHIFASPVK